MTFLTERVFDPILNSPEVSEQLKRGCRLTMTRMNQRDAAGMIRYLLVSHCRNGAQHRFRCPDEAGGVRQVRGRSRGISRSVSALTMAARGTGPELTRALNRSRHR